MKPGKGTVLSGIFLFILAVSFLTSTVAFAQAKFTGVKSAIVADFVDKTKRFDGAKVADQIRLDMADQAGFKVLSKSETLSLYKRLKIQRKKMVLASYRKSIGKLLKVDAIIIGAITKDQGKFTLTMKMEKIKPYKIINTKSFTFKKEIGPNASRFATAKFLGVPYQSPIAAQNAPEPRVPIAPRTDTFNESATENAIPSEVPQQKIMPSEEETAPQATVKKEEKQAEAESAETGEKSDRDWLTIKLSPALYKNSYSVVNPAGSAVLKPLGISTGFFPSLYFSGEVWFLKFLGIDFMYNMGWLKLTVTPPGGTAFKVNTTTSQFGGGIKYRYFFSSGPKSPNVSAKMGYSLQEFKPGAQTTNVLSKNKYSDLSIGIGSKIPMWFLESVDLGLNFSFDYFIWSKLKESVVNNGLTNSASGWQFAVGPYWKFYKYWYTSLDYVYNAHKATFNNPDTAQGTRADSVAGAKSSDKFTGLLLFVGVNF